MNSYGGNSYLSSLAPTVLSLQVWTTTPGSIKHTSLIFFFFFLENIFLFFILCV